MRRYDFDKGLLEKNEYIIPIYESEDYDDIVDDSHFVLDSENCRNAVFSSVNGSSFPQYDSDVEKVDDFIVAMRQGKLTPEEVWQKQQELQQTIKDDLAFEQSKIDAENMLKKIDASKSISSNAKDEPAE